MRHGGVVIVAESVFYPGSAQIVNKLVFRPGKAEQQIEVMNGWRSLRPSFTGDKNMSRKGLPVGGQLLVKKRLPDCDRKPEQHGDYRYNLVSTE